jgi:hypothetical protein
MKVILGFVSNSSSSSFVCDISGRVESGWDMCLRDAEMCECENGHCVGEEHIVSLIDDVIKKDGVDKVNEMVFAFYEIDDEDAKESVHFSNGHEFIHNVVDEVDDARYSLPAEFCPICSLTSITDVDMLLYLLKKADVMRKDIAAVMKKEFDGNHNQLREWLKK